MMTRTWTGGNDEDVTGRTGAAANQRRRCVRGKGVQVRKEAFVWEEERRTTRKAFIVSAVLPLSATAYSSYNIP